MVKRARLGVEWWGLVGLLLGAGACADDDPGVTGTAESSSGSASSSTAGTGSSGPGATSVATGADTTAGPSTTSGPSSTDATGGSTTSGSASGDGSTSGGGSTDTSGGSSTTSGGGPCGNGAIDPGEQCDGRDLQGFDCFDLGLGAGTLACTPVTCDFDTSMCGGGMGSCGNGLIDPGEQCDGADLQGFDCLSLGLGGGTLGCDPITCTFDTSMCMPGGGTSG